MLGDNTDCEAVGGCGRLCDCEPWELAGCLEACWEVGAEALETAKHARLMKLQQCETVSK